MTIKDKIIDLIPFMRKQEAYCPECDSTDSWVVCLREDRKKRFKVTAIICMSDTCQGKTMCPADRDGLL